jgi:2-amino-4-hydroxy-6-hydroxymethyldihydropteridine diphosphokinase
MAIVYLALGSNVGKGDQQFDSALKALREHLTDIKQASRYTSAAVGFTDQPDFLNTVIEAETDLSPQELLAFTQMTEQKVGRIRRFRWGPREIDIDIIFYDDQIIDEPDLSIPHPRFAKREFILKPLLDLNPDLIDPVSKKTIQQLYEQLPAENRVIKS